MTLYIASIFSHPKTSQNPPEQNSTHIQGGYMNSERIIRESERLAITGISRTTCWEMEKKGQFPKRRKLTPNGSSVGWFLSEINEWIQSRTVM